MQQQQNQNQQQNQQSQQQTYAEPPQMITTKDSLYLNDMLAWNLNVMKKAHAASQQCQDPEVKAELDKCGQMHQRHYQKLLTHLNTNTSNQTMM